MTSADNIGHLFKVAHNSHARVDVTLSNNNVISFKEDLLNVFLQIAFEGMDTGDPSSAILERARYKRINMTGTLYDWQLVEHKS